MHSASMERRRKIEEYRKKRQVGEMRESLFDKALGSLILDKKIRDFFLIGRTRHVIVVREVYKVFPVYPTNILTAKKYQGKFPGRIFIPVGLSDSVDNLASRILAAINNNKN